MRAQIPETNRVLIIDDSVFIHKLILARLRPEGLVVSGELSGQGGLERALADPPDLILLDINMPDLDGFEVGRRLKEAAKTRHVPIVFLTGKGDTASKVQGLDIGAVDYVTKPFDQIELVARVRAALRTKRLQDLLEQQSFLDALTGLWNRRFLDLRIDSELAAVRRTGRPLSLVLTDIDHFKQINDHHGHACGDHVLQQVAKTLQVSVDPSDVVARYGGEEFAIVLSDTDLAAAAKVAERTRCNLHQREFEGQGEAIQITASFGVACTQHLDEPSPETLVQAADRALFAAKNNGRNACHVFEEDQVLPPSA